MYEGKPFDVCPHCGDSGDQLEYSFGSPPNVVEDMVCHACGTTWTQVYEPFCMENIKVKELKGEEDG